MATATIIYNGYGTASGNVSIYDSLNNLLWHGTGAQIDTSASAPWISNLTRSSGSLTDGTASISLNFPNAAAAIALSGGTSYEINLTGNTSYTTDSDDYLIYSASNLPEFVVELTQLSAPSAVCKSSSATKIIGTFGAVENASSYLTRYGTSNPPTGDGSAYSSGNAISGLTAGTTYYLQFKTVGNGTTHSDSDWSDVITCATLASGQLKVLNNTDTAPPVEGSLRKCIEDAVAGNTITFDSSLSGETITILRHTEILLNKNLSLDASGLAEKITISGNNDCRVFFITSSTVSISHLIIGRF